MKRFLILLTLALAGTVGLALYPATRPTVLATLDRVGLGDEARRLLPVQAGGGRSEPATADARAVVPPAVSVVDAVLMPFRDQLFVSGTLVAREEALVGAQVDGLRIDQVLAEDGDRVEAGQVLARLDRSQLETLLAGSDAAIARADASIEQARSQIQQFQATGAQATADLNRAQSLGSGVLSQSSLDARLAVARAAEAQLAGARGALAAATAERRSQDAARREIEVRLARTEVRAPVAGVISRRSARVGAQTSGSGEPLFRLVKDGAIDLDAEAPDDALARVKVGMATQVTLAGNDSPFTGSVRLVGSEVDKATRLGRVRIALPAVAPGRIGAFASAVVDVARRDGVAVPASAVTRGERGRVVQVVQDGRVEVRSVETGLAARDLVELTEGVRAGESVVARAAAFLRAGDIVRAIAAGTKEAAR